jgi:hypothetical protein
MGLAHPAGAITARAFNCFLRPVEALHAIAGLIVGVYHSKHNRTLAGAIIRVIGKPLIVCRNPKHHCPHSRVVSIFSQRTHFFGSHSPMRRIPEKIVRVRATLLSQRGRSFIPPKNR